jgi:two-component system cell cycle sensor histidine kinase/response regulator CckA
MTDRAQVPGTPEAERKNTQAPIPSAREHDAHCHPPPRSPRTEQESKLATDRSQSSSVNEICVSDIHVRWDPRSGTCTFEDLPVAMMWIDTTLTGVMSGLQYMVGTARFGLALQSEGRKSVEADWQVISQCAGFREGFQAIANIAAVAGWGEWKLLDLDESARQCRFRAWNTWEGRYQKALGVCWGSAMLAGKLAGYCSRLFGTNCWADQVAWIAKGDPFDEFQVHPSDRSVEQEIEELLATDEATRADMAVALQSLRSEISERERAEQALRLTKFAVDHGAEAAFWVDPNARLTYVNEAACRLLGYTREELLSMTVRDIDPDFLPEVWLDRSDNLPDRTTLAIECNLRRKDDRRVPVEITLKHAEFEGREYFFTFARDITERRQAEQERRRLETQLRQSQKMEAVGQLAGGVAHDFNNILTAILGSVELSLASVRGELAPDHTVIRMMEQIEDAAQHAASLTRQLLTFSRRDVVRPQVLSLNRILLHLDRMLRRLITENIALDTITEPDLRSVHADPGQMEQVIVNLVVNAVHAMPDGGRLTLQTRNVTLDGAYASNHVEARPGPHVLLEVIDTGHGMDAATRERIFEPFFTTKSADKGTGLGLATVHGIVKQAGGHIVVHSAPQRGTTFEVYLPAVDLAPAEEEPASSAESSPGGCETILLCEDNLTVRVLVAQSLRSAGYTVIEAESGETGLMAAKNHPGTIDLLVTDVIMSDMNGYVVSERLRAIRPKTPTLFVSGYTANTVIRHRVLDEGLEFLEKPFTLRSLLKRVRAVLDHAKSNTSQPGASD